MNEFQAINREIDTQGIIIRGKQRNGKTILAVNLSLDKWTRVYSNFRIRLKGKEYGTYIGSIKNLDSIKYSDVPGVVIIDEGGTNYSSRRSNSKDNREFNELLFLIGKKNCTLIFIAQRFEGLDINGKALAEHIFRVKKIRRGEMHPIFSIRYERYDSGDIKFLSQYHMDIIKFQSLNKIEYDQLEASNIIKKKELPKRGRGRPRKVATD